MAALVNTRLRHSRERKDLIDGERTTLEFGIEDGSK